MATKGLSFAEVEGRTPMQPIRVAFVEDHEMVARSLAGVLAAETDMEVLDRARGVHEAIALANEHRPDVLVMDFRLPDGDGVEGTRRVREASPTTNVVMLTASSTTSIVLDALDAGACGFVSKEAPIEDLIAAVRAAALGEAHFSVGVLERIVGSRRTGESAAGADLSAREVEVLQLVADGLSTQEIADRLFLSHHTVRNHVRNILGKLGAHSKVEAVVLGTRAGLITLDERAVRDS
jgi:DNA-binding NarL/FixJ family response regulator